jgi:metal-responsive CopG/Arc/MetJ family transcriptional regulator
MAAKKFAISIPEEVMKQVDRAARARQMTRSHFIAEVLRRVAQARSDAEITRRLNEVFADETLAAEQRETARAFERAASPDPW